jgi:hypothetical protein
MPYTTISIEQETATQLEVIATLLREEKRYLLRNLINALAKTVEGEILSQKRPFETRLSYEIIREPHITKIVFSKMPLVKEKGKGEPYEV